MGRSGGSTELVNKLPHINLTAEKVFMPTILKQHCLNICGPLKEILYISTGLCVIKTPVLFS